ncbi:MAG: homoserine dehydrogenase [Proteobacteria bacterium]|nr:homoserine dehydrogenase [Pseudomonadota bacterium]
MADPLKLGIAGLGTVGAGVLDLLAQRGGALASNAGRGVAISGVSARDKNKKRAVDISSFQWFDDPVALARCDDIDVFVELIGGEEGAAKASVEAALKAGKHVVTANKALLAYHGLALARLADENGVALNFEAAVAGGIPAIKTIRESLLANNISRVYGILNGTCNYILTRMQKQGRNFDEVLREAQDAGYAEADPSFDIDGHDTAHKLTLLTTLAFGVEASIDTIYVEGIRSISLADIVAADELGYRIKLLGIALKTGSGIEQRVHPTMVPKNTAIAEVDGVMNCVAFDSDFAGDVMLIGPGAGARPTASSVLSDILDIARGTIMPPFGRATNSLKAYERARMHAHEGGYYIALSVFDRPGAFAAIAGRMAEQDISLESIVQHRPRAALPGLDARTDDGSPLPVVMITHETTEAAIRAALRIIEKEGNVNEPPRMIRIEKM